jgi:Fe-Mn family superoxide dismutase
LSGKLLESHYENNYGGAIRRLNAIEKQLAEIDWPTSAVFNINGIKREELIAANSMILHEVYFNCLGEEGGEALAGQHAELSQAVQSSFGSIEQWQCEFTAMARALAGGSGWVLLSWSRPHNRLINQWANEHLHNLAGATPILALDMFEHAYHLDYGANAAGYIEAFMQNIHWGRVSQRFKQALNLSNEPAHDQPIKDQMNVRELNDALACSDIKPYVLDVRLEEDRRCSGWRVLETPWQNPTRVQQWAKEIPEGVPVVVYCMYGLWVSQNAAKELRELGCDAYSLAGGIAAWRAMGYASTPV